MIAINDLIHRYPHLQTCERSIKEAIFELSNSFKAGGKLLVCGNGGSSSDAEHLCGELVKGFLKKRLIKGEEAVLLNAVSSELSKNLQMGLPAFSLGVSHALISAFSNDLNPEYIYAQQVYVHANKNDIVFGISTSGNSKSILHALEVAKAKGVKSILLTGTGNSACGKIADIVINAPANRTHEIQELHLPIYHAICIELENIFFGDD